MPQTDSTEKAISVWRRHMELPRYLRAVEGRDALADAVDEIVGALGIGRPCLVTGRAVSRDLAQRIAPSTLCVAIDESSVDHVRKLAERSELKQADAVIAVGGCKAIDVGKSVCRELDLPVMSVPTQLSTDGIGSPISVLRKSDGEVASLPARLPIAVVADLELVAGAPIATTRAGLGDLLAKPTALHDWRLAARASNEAAKAPDAMALVADKTKKAAADEIDDFAALLGEVAFEAVFEADVTAIGDGRAEIGFLRRLLNGLVLSGLAMEIAGSSRPCSGSEHLISHAMDHLLPNTALHGEQVAFGAIVAARLQGEDWQRLRSFMIRAGMDRVVSGFGLEIDAIIEVIQCAPETRKDRYTILDEVDLSPDTLRPVVEEVLGA